MCVQDYNSLYLLYVLKCNVNLSFVYFDDKKKRKIVDDLHLNDRVIVNSLTYMYMVQPFFKKKKKKNRLFVLL